MNGYQRIQAALKGEAVDKIPIMLHNFLLAAEEHGISMGQYRESPQLIAETFIKSVEKYDYDGILVDIDTVTLAGAVGVPVDFPEHEPARSPGGCLAKIENVSNLKTINIENYKYVDIWLEAVRKIKEYFGDEIYVRGNCDQSPFSLASMMRGSQEWMLDLFIAEQSHVEMLLEYCTDISCQFVRLMVQTGCDMVSNGDSVAGPEMISPEMYERYALPYEKRVIEAAHEKGIPYTLHICGNTELILKKMLESDADALELDYKTDVNRAFKILDNKATFIGNIDPSGVIAMGTPELVIQKTNELLEIFSKTNRFILNAGCAIPPNTPEANMRALVETARNF